MTEPRKPNQLGRFVREPKEKVIAASPETVARYLQEHIYTPWQDVDQEEMWVLLLDTRLRVTHEVMVYRGTVNSTPCRGAELLKEAVKLNSPALILSHCHPSGVPNPSAEDWAMTDRIASAAHLLDIKLTDHLIVGQNSWVSLRMQGLRWLDEREKAGKDV